MNEDNTQNNLKTEILEKIKKGEVEMKPKWHFAFKVTILVCLAVLVLVTTVFLVSYTVFSIIVSGHLLLLGFGWRGLYAFMLLFPWTVFCVDIVFAFVLDLLLRKFKFGYHRPVVLLFAGTTIILFIVGYAVSVSPIHGMLLHRAERDNLPMVGPFYNHLRVSHRERGVLQGIVTSVNGTMFTITHDSFDTDNDEATTTIIAPMDISGFLTVGDHVFVAGDIMQDGEIRAYGVTKFSVETQ